MIYFYGVYVIMYRLEGLNLPVVTDEQQIWFVRTNGGTYYNDFVINNYVALGWNLISKDLILDTKTSNDAKREKIQELYPEQKRPGLIFGQLVDFHIKMKTNDLVLIPSEGTKYLKVGLLGTVVDDVIHASSDEEYNKCTHLHKRKVKWISEIDLSRDIYLSKIIKVQQTISNITNYQNYILRNIYPYYISDNSIHLTLQKTTNSDMGMSSSIELQKSIISIVDTVFDLYKVENNSDEITLKVAVGSPGFWEVIIPKKGPAAIAVSLLFKLIVGKLKDESGSSKTGIIGFLDEINVMLNGHAERKKLAAEVKTMEEQREIELEIKVAQKNKIDAETRKINAEAQLLEQQYSMMHIPTNDELEIAVNRIDESAKVLEEVSSKNGIKCTKDVDTELAS